MLQRAIEGFGFSKRQKNFKPLSTTCHSLCLMSPVQEIVIVIIIIIIIIIVIAIILVSTINGSNIVRGLDAGG
eukprot:993447-Amphidinium_carterae.1